MLASTWHLLLVAALGASYLAISRRLDERLGGAVAAVLWALTAVGAFEVETVETVAGNTTAAFDNTTGNVTINATGGQVVRETTATPEVAFLAAGLALVMTAFTLAAATGQLPDRSATRFDS